MPNILIFSKKIAIFNLFSYFKMFENATLKNECRIGDINKNLKWKYNNNKNAKKIVRRSGHKSTKAKMFNLLPYQTKVSPLRPQWGVIF